MFVALQTRVTTRTGYKPTGKTVAQAYFELDSQARRAFLLDREIKVYAWREESDNRLKGDVRILPEGLGIVREADSSRAWMLHAQEGTTPPRLLTSQLLAKM
jgi:hypothetical protein